ncbi:hypothetical protein [Nocardioides dilutus]
MLAVDLTLGFVVLTVVGGASAVASRPLWTQRPHLAPAYALLGLGLVAHVVWVLFWVEPLVGKAGSIALLATAAAVVARDRPWRVWQQWAPLVTLTAGVGALIVGFTFLWGGADNPFATEVTRFVSLPSDNSIPHLFADRLWKGESTIGFLGDWNGSDRPPLQSGLLLLVRPLGRFLGVAQGADQYELANMQLAAASSILAQLMWVPAVHCLVRTLRLRRVTAAVTVLFCAASPAVFLHTTYTWPKLMAAGLAVAATVLLVDPLVSGARPRVPDFVAAMVLAVLAFLTHGAVVFCAPLLILLGVLVLRRTDRRSGARSVGVGALLAVLAYLPWALYTRVADPSNNRLLKWHFAGVTEPNNDSLVATIVHAYRTTPGHELLANRRANLANVFRLSLTERLDFTNDWPSRMRAYDFYGTAIALGLSSLLTVGLVVWVGTRLLLRLPVRASERVGMILCLGSVASIIFWALVMFLPDGAIVHQGSYAWLLVLLAVPFAFLADRVPALGWVLIGFGLMYVQVAYSSPTERLVGPLSRTSLVTMLAGAVLCGLATWAMTSGSDTQDAPRGAAGRRSRM